MKKLLNLLPVSFCLLLLSADLNAQLYKIELDQKVKKSSIILEGKVVALKSFWNDAHTMIYTANTIEVYKLFKGNTAEKTIEIITEGGGVGGQYIEASDLLKLDEGETGIFFCFQNALQRKSPFTQKVLYDVYSSDQGFLRYDSRQDMAYAPFVNYKGIEKNLYQLLQSKTGESIRTINNSFKPSDASEDAAGILATISSFSPDSVHAGALNDPANNVLTINGTGFGATPSGKCAVRFKDGNKSGTQTDYEVKYNSPYIISWTDTTIEVRVPYRAATGRIAVVNSAGTQSSSQAILTVVYSVFSIEFEDDNGNTYVKEIRLMNTNESGGYSLKYCTSTEGEGMDLNAAPEKLTFQRALATWKEAVGVNFVEAGTTTTQTVDPNDDENIIMFDNNNTGNATLGDGVLATTYSGFDLCDTQFAAQKVGFDVVLRNDSVSKGTASFEIGPCFPSSTEIDLEMVIFHELGHALNLGHINDTQEGNAPNVNPSKLMHYAVGPYVGRRSPDFSAFTGAQYCVKKQNNSYGCGYTSEMTPLSATVISNDECPGSFPTTATAAGTIVTFDLTHATSNKYGDPQSDDVNCQELITNVTNNAYYAIKTSSITGSTLKLAISEYATTPAELSSCTGQGVRMALYEVSSCPAGQSFPTPVKCLSFSTNGTLADITSLKANTTYLLYFDGIRNTKAKFKATLNGTALPITLSKFYGEYVKGMNKLYIDIVQAINVRTITVEKSASGNVFAAIGDLSFAAANLAGKHTYMDAQPFAGNNYYRLAIKDNDGSVQYSNVILLKNDEERIAYIYPNPVRDIMNININTREAAKYHCNIYDLSGKLLISKVYDIAEGSQQVSVPFTLVGSGAYMVKITDAKGEVVLRQRILKQP